MVRFGVRSRVNLGTVFGVGVRVPVEDRVRFGVGFSFRVKFMLGLGL